jgi:hypothetical protein
MLNNSMITQNVLPVANCEAFLDTLYGSAPQERLLELRCIHPTTEQVRSLWSPIQDRKAVLKQVDQLNTQGYGIYFAPCLRTEKKGNAQSASYVPALWVDIDCDDDLTQRETALRRLNEFDLKPSVIVDSGGGWHGYWLLANPFILEADDDRTYIANILKGLFQVLGGDEGYVKSVASVMRLPASINTKPERDGACVNITCLEPDIRYDIQQFDWFKVAPKNVQPYSVSMTNDQHPLPARTEHYLNSGAYNGSRNQELFAAACQMRDAGYSQSDTERELVARHLADGTGSEKTASREKEAKTTITSAFSQSSREPIVSPKHHARQFVQQLIGQYQVENKPDRPTTQQIVEAVEACVHLNAIEWAEQREQFKLFTGNGLKISDIDRLYREKKKALEREARDNLVDTEEYLEIKNQMVYRKYTHRGTVQKIIASWSAKILESINRVDDDGKRERVARVQVEGNSSKQSLDVPSELFGDANALQRFLAANAGETFTTRAGMSKHLTPAILSLSGQYSTRETYRFMGWTQLQDRWMYLTPSATITAKGKLNNPPEVDLSSRLQDYGVQTCTWAEALSAFDTMLKVFPQEIVATCISFALLPLLQRFFPASATRPALHMAGTYGSGKSELAALMCSFYGRFTRDTPPAQWGDTINTVEALGYPLLDALYWVDDYKHIYADERTYTRFLQSYSRGMGRGRLTREAKLRQERPCRGLILSTGETTIEGEASVLSRMLVIDVPPWEHRDPNGQVLADADMYREQLTGFTAHFASWIAQQVETGTLQEDISQYYEQSIQGYRKKIQQQVKGNRANTGRLVSNWATLVTAYQVLSQFLKDMDDNYQLPVWQDSIEETIQSVRSERASEVFLDVLGQLIASGEVILAENRQNPVEPPPGKTIIGYKDSEFIHLLPEIAFRAVNRVQALKFTASAIGSQLKEDGILLTHNGGRNLTVRVRVRGNRIRAWRLRANAFDGTD